MEVFLQSIVAGSGSADGFIVRLLGCAHRTPYSCCKVGRGLQELPVSVLPIQPPERGGVSKNSGVDGVHSPLPQLLLILNPTLETSGTY